MKRKLTISLSLAAAMFLLLASTVLAAPKAYVVDDANLFEDAEVVKILDTANAAATKTGLDFVIHTTNDTGGKETNPYADDFFDYNGYGADAEGTGIILVIDMQHRVFAVSASGKGLNYYSPKDIDSIMDTMVVNIAEGEYGTAALAFVAKAEEIALASIGSGRNALEETKSEQDIDTTQTTGTGFFAKLGSVAPMALLVALLIAAAVVGIMLLSHSAKLPKAPSATQYFAPQGVRTTHKADIFLRSHISKRPIPQQNHSSGGGGGSSVRTGSSGRTHVGGSRKF